MYRGSSRTKAGAIPAGGGCGGKGPDQGESVPTKQVLDTVPGKDEVVKADSVNLPNAMERIRQAASRDKQLRFTTLWHHVYDIEHLRKAYFSLKRNAAPGVDGETWRHYGENLEENLQDLCRQAEARGVSSKAGEKIVHP